MEPEQYLIDAVYPARLIPLTQGKFAMVDAEDYERVMAMGWWDAYKCGNNWYAKRHIVEELDGKKVRRTLRMHKFITGFYITDHVNRNGLDNRRVNLRDATPTMNAGNRRKRSDNTSGYTGIHRTRSGTWVAQVTRDRKTTHVGCYATIEEAYEAREFFLREGRRP